MRFKHKRGSQIPDVNLVPMLDVLMVVLTFFIIVSMTLTMQQGVEVQLPSQEPAAPDTAEPKVAIVKLNAEGQLLFENQPTESATLNGQVKAFLQANPKGAVVLQADEKLPYETVIQLLGQMKESGGERVSLAIE